ncbi:hypothetical protein LTR56_020695 [Elasticomyces elasticus]|nr:hypothetical protein LTR22_028394 [Elasticomyces elasticus]KAK3624964.1 hypothetical protein LTR56_020695 [Elasticomyces elasticus]KAK4901907.1 hypothetical protein LTR49_027172 [Elasticomyces elasticus]KAK5747621.1 hypothetical protein LTS12_022319 [Elasticomyces elasticus]
MQQGCQEASQQFAGHERHERNQRKWPSRISPSAFAKYAKVMEAEFRLNVHFAATTKSMNGDWLDHKNSRWQMDAARKTTLCYLTLPRRSGPECRYIMSEEEADFSDFISTAELPAAKPSKLTWPHSQSRTRSVVASSAR